ncbi:MAG: MBL fold metallo-hydrolase [Deltaproteobacteria bacterium]|jgi:phosphoribosyl 1,2-cyclic phosphate phosphodiesterase|nr:MBL fold metallo-hydrolase [Deltaproteobacteria bacterium]MCL6119506.1 MBL fold metallo-hydrolase [Deltaproteobacteria bacterium]
MKILVLGCGTSTGVPLIGCRCKVCASENPKNKRLRPSILVSENNFDILIDTAPDLRTQALKFHIVNIDAVLYTHTHADHIFGIDDLRMFNYLKKQDNRFIPVYASETAVNFIKDKFDYIFKEKTESSKPYLIPNIIKESLEIKPGLFITPIPVYHGKNLINGYRINDFAYITDVSSIPKSSLDLLKGIKVLMIDALRFDSHKTHLSIAEAIIIAEKINPSRTYFTHMGHNIDYDEIKEICSCKSEKLIPSYDGLSIEL